LGGGVPGVGPDSRGPGEREGEIEEGEDER